MIAICRSLCDKPGKLTGAEFRYVRTGLSLSQKAVGKLFGYTEQAVAKWEKYGKVPKTIDAALRVVFIERHNNNHLVPKMIDLLELIDRIANSRVVASVVNAKWVAKLEFHNAGNPLPAAASRSVLADA